VACWRRDDGPYFPPLHVLDIQQALVRNGSDELVCLKFQFDCGIRDLKGRRFELVLEQPRAWEFWYGGMRTPLVDGGPYWDPAFRRVDVTPFVRRGRNVLELKRPWHVEPSRRGAVAGVVARQEGRRDSPRRAAGGEPRTGTPNTELEAVYLVGDFGVAFPRGTSRGRRVPARREWMRGVPRLVDEPLATTGRDLVRAGYPFFAGRLALTKDVVLREAPSPGARLELSPPAAVTATVEINGQEAGTVWKAPWTVPAGEFLVRGTNRIAVTLTTGLRNLLGPHRWGGPGPDLVTADAFAGATPASGGVPPDGAGRAANRRYRADYNVVDFGLGGAAVLRY
jgi:hypothetical protein